MEERGRHHLLGRPRKKRRPRRYPGRVFHVRAPVVLPDLPLVGLPGEPGGLHDDVHRSCTESGSSWGNTLSAMSAALQTANGKVSASTA